MFSKQSHAHLDIITTAFAVVLILSNIASTKIAAIGSFSFDGGLVLFPLAYIFGDILTEVYGYARARRVIWIGFAMNLLMVLTFWLVGLLPADPMWGLQESYMHILGVVPRIVVASLIAYLVGEFMNSFILAKMKVRTSGKHFWQRAIGSTIVGQGLDTTLFVLIAFWGILPGSLLWTIWLTNCVAKVVVEIILLPVTSKVVTTLKIKEATDHFDNHTKFSPFVFKEKK